MVVSLTACESKEEAAYKSALEAFEEQNYESAIEGFTELGNYEDSATLLLQVKQAQIYEYIENIGVEIEDDSTIDAMIDMCGELTISEFSEIENSARFEELFCAYIETVCQKGDWDEALDFVHDMDFLSNDCTETTLITYGRWGSVESAEEYIKERLKSPRSYYRYNASVSTPTQNGDDDYYIVDVYLDYGATNSFGGEVTSEDHIVVHFIPDVEDRTVTFDCIGDALDVLSDALKNAGF
ncbi:MAG: hypothetical protein SNI70_03675 [Rikenellaceae bacterium]